MVPTYHSFRQKDQGGPPLGLGRMSARDAWRYGQSLSRYKKNHGEPKQIFTGEAGLVVGVVIMEAAKR